MATGEIEVGLPDHHHQQQETPESTPPIMKFAAAASAAVASLVMAQKPSTFGLMALRSASQIHFAPFSAARSRIFLWLPQQHADCEGPDPDRATFYLEDGSLFLYSKQGETQQVFVDRSGTGQGKLGYITGGSDLPPNAELAGWSIDQHGDLYFNGTIPLACPHSVDDSWSVWIATNGTLPEEGCLGAIARTVAIDDPVRCKYSVAGGSSQDDVSNGQTAV